jgi:putative inorganic carbon (hco3(-)) transporter
MPPSRREPLIFGLTLSGAAALLVSIAAGEILLAIALAVWFVWHPRRPNLPSFFIPMCAFIVMTFASLAASPDPAIGWAVRKTIIFAMAVLSATFVTTVWRARTSHAILIAVAAVTSAVGIVQFVITYTRFLSTQQLSDDPTILARITGFMGHWLTFSGEQLLVWCAAIPAIVCLGRRWFVPVTTVGAALILSFTQGVWAGAIGAVVMVSLLMPRRLLLPLLLPLALIAATASGLIYHRISTSLNKSQDFMPVTGRIELWKAGLQMIREHPWFGVGPEKVSLEFPRHYGGTNLQNIYYGHLENDFLQIAAERGLICFATFLWFGLELYAGLFRLIKVADEGSRWIPLAAIAALTGFVISGLFEYNFGDSEVLLLLLFIVSMPFGVLHERNAQEAR